MQQVFIVLDTRDHVRRLIEASKYFTKEVNVTYSSVSRVGVKEGQYEFVGDDVEATCAPIKLLDKSRALFILNGLYTEALTAIVPYHRTKSSIDTVAIGLRDCAVPDKIDYAMAEEFLSLDEVDQVVLDIELEMNNLIKDNKWQQWNIVETPYMLGVIGGEDYRIVEWTRHFGHVSSANDREVTVDIATIARYIQAQFIERNPELGAKIALKPIIADAIMRRYPLVEFDTIGTIKTDVIAEVTGNEYEVIYSQFIKPVFDVFNLTYLLKRIDTSLSYTADITTDMKLVFETKEQPRDPDELYFEMVELKQSIERGDWVPERERRQLADYERSLR